MAILIKFTNPNINDVTINIYRGDAALDRANLGTPMDTLTGKPTEYLDRTAEQGKTYFYVFEVIGPNDRDLSRNIQLTATEARGPGNSILKLGTRELGFCAVMASADVMTVSTLAALLGITITNATSYPYMLKLARAGKMYYIPSTGVGTITYNQAEAAGLIDGKTVEYNGFKYRVRLVYGAGENDQESGAFLSGVTNGTDVDMDTQDITCEFNDLMYPVGILVPLKQRLPNYLNNTVVTLTSSRGRVLCKELKNDVPVLRTNYADTTRKGLTALTVNGTKDTAYVFWPVLELIED